MPCICMFSWSANTMILLSWVANIIQIGKFQFTADQLIEFVCWGCILLIYEFLLSTVKITVLSISKIGMHCNYHSLHFFLIGLLWIFQRWRGYMDKNTNPLAEKTVQLYVFQPSTCRLPEIPHLEQKLWIVIIFGHSHILS